MCDIYYYKIKIKKMKLYGRNIQNTEGRKKKNRTEKQLSKVNTSVIEFKQKPIINMSLF